MNNDFENKRIAKDIVNKLAEEVEQSAMLKKYLDTAKEDAIRKTVKFYVRDVLRAECSSDDIDTDALARELGVHCSEFESWESGVMSKISDMACEELLKRIQVSMISESIVLGQVGKPKYQVLLG